MTATATAGQPGRVSLKELGAGGAQHFGTPFYVVSDYAKTHSINFSRPISSVGSYPSLVSYLRYIPGTGVFPGLGFHTFRFYMQNVLVSQRVARRNLKNRG